MLQNPVYVGSLRIGVNPKGAFFRCQGGKETPAHKTGEPTPVVVANAHEGIIDRALWERVQAKIKRNFKQRRPPRNSGPYALSGIVVCGNCGRPMYASKDPTGRVIYRCHRVEVGASTCGYWIAYESDLLPFITGKFLGDVREHIQQEAANIRQRVETDEAADLRKELAKLDRKLETARERFLTAPTSVVPGVLAQLERMEKERQDLQARIGGSKIKGPAYRLLEWFTNYAREFDSGNGFLLDQAMTVASQDGKVSVEIPVRLPPQVIREKLKHIDTRLFVWFVRKQKGRGYDLQKVRVQAELNGSLSCEYAGNAAS
jgi:hypothetical protein